MKDTDVDPNESLNKLDKAQYKVEMREMEKIAAMSGSLEQNKLAVSPRQ